MWENKKKIDNNTSKPETNNINKPKTNNMNKSKTLQLYPLGLGEQAYLDTFIKLPMEKKSKLYIPNQRQI